ncbi:Bombyxin B-1 [Eumeta japonica]|uniref:Bombyxin B-1 n=1 Tax=Eumeta variegata TaxID=151549 RepID=A0A4C2AD83_EUMVA|nr:Bombyxin B-1 [Eumeta japonica]
MRRSSLYSPTALMYRAVTDVGNELERCDTSEHVIRDTGEGQRGQRIGAPRPHNIPYGRNNEVGDGAVPGVLGAGGASTDGGQDVRPPAVGGAGALLRPRPNAETGQRTERLIRVRVRAELGAGVAGGGGARRARWARHKRGLVDECCLKPCTVSEIISYC